MAHYSIEPKTRECDKEFGFFLFTRNLSGKMEKN